MRRINDYTVEIDITDFELSIPEGTVFIGCELKYNQIVIWTDEPVDYERVHTVLISTFAESGTYSDDAVPIGFCGNRLYAEDETFHAVVQCNSMPILTARPPIKVINPSDLIEK